MSRSLKAWWNEPLSSLVTWVSVVAALLLFVLVTVLMVGEPGWLAFPLGIWWGIVLVHLFLTFHDRRRLRRSVIVTSYVPGPDGTTHVIVETIDPKRLRKDDPRRDIVAGMKNTGSPAAHTTGHVDPDTGHLVLDEWEFENPKDQPH